MATSSISKKPPPAPKPPPPKPPSGDNKKASGAPPSAPPAAPPANTPPSTAPSAPPAGLKLLKIEDTSLAAATPPSSVPPAAPTGGSPAAPPQGSPAAAPGSSPAAPPGDAPAAPLADAAGPTGSPPGAPPSGQAPFDPSTFDPNKPPQFKNEQERQDWERKRQEWESWRNGGSTPPSAPGAPPSGTTPAAPPSGPTPAAPPGAPPVAGTPPGAAPTASVSAEDEKALRTWKGNYIEWVNALSTSSMASAAAVAGRDFSAVGATDSVASFAEGTQGFLEKIKADGEKIQNIAGDRAFYTQNILDLDENYAAMSEKYGKEAVDKIFMADPTTNGQLQTARIAMAKSVDTYNTATNSYLDEVNAKATLTLDNWEKTKSNESTKSALGAVSTLLSLAGGVLYGGPGMMGLFTQPLRSLAGAANVGGASFLAGAVWGQTNGLFKTDPRPQAVSDEILGTLTKLQDRLNDWVKEQKDREEERRRQGSWYIPSV